ncbi:hypothetical protein GOTRE_019_00390 [Gordonia terrae NBRC 100016]|uniref:Uncharacterized protein n=1 Tax=Gordonia terrae NBRC 100016 TaxID=1089454 RepID=A0ABQ0H9P9_9ACTN|nr:hypothetical protein GOTRE_019_00390 [Gordonia terrae NBRC 100016]
MRVVTWGSYIRAAPAQTGVGRPAVQLSAVPASAEVDEDRGRPPRVVRTNHELNLPNEPLPRGPSLANVRAKTSGGAPESGVSA